MKTTSRSLVFFGNECLATGTSSPALILKSLIENGYKIEALILHNEPTKSRNSRPPEVANVAKKNNIPVFYPKKLSDIAEDLKKLKACAGVLAAFGKIVPENIINVFPKGIVNIHPSLLPLHRGPTPIESVILNGDSETGVSIMQLSKEMDAGNVYGQSIVKLQGNESKQELTDKLSEIGRAMLLELLPGILDGTIVALPQDNQKATYDKLISKKDGTIDWQKPATLIEHEIRAYLGWPQSRTKFGNLEVIITKAHVLPGSAADSKPSDYEILKNSGTILVATGNGKLCVESLKPTGKPEMSAKAFIAGYGKRLA